MINTISGVSSLFIYEYNHKKYYFFGDYHGTRKGNCAEQGLQCDAFNYNFSATTNANTKCTTLGALFYNWFAYNNKNNIKTDFYLEEYYTKENERVDDLEYINIIKNRSTKNTRQGSPFKDKSWMQLLPYIMAPCFIRDKLNCPFYPNVHLHYIDVRSILTSKGLVNISPFSIEKILIHLIEHQPTTVEELIILREEVLGLIYFLIKNARELLNYLLFNDLGNYKALLLSSNSIFVLEIIDHIFAFVNHEGIFKVAYELHRLKTDIYQLLINYIDIMIDKVLLKIRIYEQSIAEGIKRYNIMKKRNVLHTRGLRRGYEDLLVIVNGYDLQLIDLDSILMDVYTLSRMFVQDGDEIIVFAGVYHINIYKDFFNLFTSPLLSIPYKNGINCLTHEDISIYINLNQFK